MRYLFYFAFLGLFLFASCNGIISEKQESNIEDKTPIVAKKDTTISNEIYEILFSYITNNKEQNHINFPLLCVFSQDLQDTLLIIGYGYPENPTIIDGYINLSETNIGFINCDLVNQYNFVNSTTLLKDSIGQLFRTDQDLTGWHIDPIGNKYKIHGSDSLKLIYSGYL